MTPTLPSKTTAAAPFYTRYGFSRPATGSAQLRIDPYPGICANGQLKRTVLVSAVDLVASLFVREEAGVDATFTSDLSLRAPRFGIPGRLEVRGEILRVGARLITTEVRIEDGGELFALGESTFSRIPRKGPAQPRIEDLRLPRVFDSNPLDQPLEREVGIERIPDEPGLVRLPLEPQLLNPEGILQGALVGLLIESAAESLGGANAVVEEMDLRYLAASKAGPIEARASWIEAKGPGPDRPPSMMRVWIRDLGQSGRLAASAFVRIRHPTLR
jgi:acyl-coenzyme A thioesterase PaaI-like protein